MWKKQGNLLDTKMAQLPVVSLLDNRILLTFSDRDADGRSFGNLAEIIVKEGKLDCSIIERNILSKGQPGDYDAAGTMPMQIIDNKLFFIGWTLRQDVPYFNYTSVAEIDNTNVRKIGPILSPDVVDSGYSGTLNVVWNEHECSYVGYYLSGTGWENDENKQLQPCYDLKIATSDNLLNWKKSGVAAIALKPCEAGLSSATVIQDTQGAWHMWFSTRASQHFRDGDGAYSIKHAISKDGFNWSRSENFGLTHDRNLGENMAAYPSVFCYKNTLYLLYNGFAFGKGGISYATMELSKLSDLSADLLVTDNI